MNRENYKSTRNKPKRSKVTRSKSQMLAEPKATTSSATPKLRAIYNSRTEWITKVIPKQKEK